MRQLRIECVGETPLLMDRIDELLVDVIRPKTYIEPTGEDVAKKKIYRDKHSQIGLPSAMLLAALMEAERQMLCREKTHLARAASNSFQGFLKIEEKFLLLPAPHGKNEPNWTLFSRHGYLKISDAVICLHLPKFKDWGFTCTPTFDPQKISADRVEKLFTLAGRYCGLGTYRPSCRGPFGSFTVKSIVDITPNSLVNTVSGRHSDTCN